MPRSVFALLVMLLVALAAGHASAEDKALAETLFLEGKEMFKQGKLEEACKRFRASHQAEESVGALANLALCHQKMGKLATAWNVYREAAALAARLKQPEREKGALEYAREIEPLLSKLTVEVNDPVAGLEVTVDDVVWPAAAFGQATPIDSGAHVIIARAPDHEEWRGEVEIGTEKDRQTVSIPTLRPLERAPAPEEPPKGDLHPRAIVGLAVGGFGAACLVVGVILGAVALDREGDLACSPAGVCSPAEYEKVQDIEPIAHGATAMTVIGAAAVIGGGVLFLTAPRILGDATGWRVLPLVGPGFQGGAIVGRF